MLSVTNRLKNSSNQSLLTKPEYRCTDDQLRKNDRYVLNFGYFVLRKYKWKNMKKKKNV